LICDIFAKKPIEKDQAKRVKITEERKEFSERSNNKKKQVKKNLMRQKKVGPTFKVFVSFEPATTFEQMNFEERKKKHGG